MLGTSIRTCIDCIYTQPTHIIVDNIKIIYTLILILRICTCIISIYMIRLQNAMAVLKKYGNIIVILLYTQMRLCYNVQIFYCSGYVWICI